MSYKSEEYIPGLVVKQEQDTAANTVVTGTGVITYDPASFRRYSDSGAAVTEVKTRLTFEPFIMAFEIGTGIQSQTTPLWTVPFKCKLLDAYLKATSSVASTTFQLLNDASAITNAMDVPTDTAVVRPGTTVEAQLTFAVGETLKVVQAAGATQPGCWIVCTFARIV